MNCGSCKATLPPGFDFKFCPFCGAGIKAKAPSTTDPYIDDGGSEEKTLDDGGGEAETVFEMPAVKMEAAEPEKPRRKKKKKKKKRKKKPAPQPTAASKPPAAGAGDLQDKPTVVMDAVTPEMLADMISQDEAPAPKLSAESMPAAAGPGEPGFSETAWFMAAVTPEQLAEAEGEALDYSEQDIMTDRYRVTEKLPDEVRKDFSLSYGKKPLARKKKKKKKKKKR